MNELIQKINVKTIEFFRVIRPVLKAVRNKLFTGILVAIPIIVTLWVLQIAYNFIKGISNPVLAQIWLVRPDAQTHDPGLTIGQLPGVSFFVTILILVLLGVMATNVLGQRILEWMERLMLRVPIVATIYTAVKQVIDSIRSFNNAANFKRVVYIEYPSEGCRLIALVTGQFYDEALGKEMTTVVIPTAPNPMTGLVVLVESSKLIESSLTIEEATKLIVSAGLVAPRRSNGVRV